MLATYLYALSLISATPTAYYQGAPSSYSYEVEQKTTIAFYENHDEGTIYGYAEASLTYHGEYNIMSDTLNLQTGAWAYLDIHYDGSIDNDAYGETLNLPTQEDAFTPLGHFRITLEADQGIRAYIERPILPDDDWQIYSTASIWQPAGGNDEETLSGQTDLGITKGAIKGLFKENGYLPWTLESEINFGNARYQEGKETGYREGYNNGLIESGNQGSEAMTNMFGILGLAFSSVASFFELRLFGFLPLYWVFLAPLFIAIVTLIMRMVKH